MMNYINNLLPERNRLERIWKIAQVDFRKRYYNNKLGIIWALFNPLSQIAIYYFIFTRVWPKDDVENYALYIFCGIITWLAFAESTTIGSRLLLSKKYLIENIEFNWIDLYYAHLTSSLLGLSFNISAYFIIALLSGVLFNYNLLYLPIILASWSLTTLSVAMLLSLIRPVIDDIIHLWNILLLMGFWASGIFFSGEFYFTKYTWFVYANPFVGIILNIRACLLYGNKLYLGLIGYNISYAIILFLIATKLFRKYSRKVCEKL